MRCACVVAVVLAVLVGGCASQQSISNAMKNIEELYEAQCELIKARLEGDTSKVVVLEKKVSDLEAAQKEAVDAVVESQKKSAENVGEAVNIILGAIASIFGVGGALAYRKRLLNTTPPNPGS